MHVFWPVLLLKILFSIFRSCICFPAPKHAINFIGLFSLSFIRDFIMVSKVSSDKEALNIQNEMNWDKKVNSALLTMLKMAHAAGKKHSTKSNYWGHVLVMT